MRNNSLAGDHILKLILTGAVGKHQTGSGFIIINMFNKDGKVLLLENLVEIEKYGILISVEEAFEQIRRGHILINKARSTTKLEYDHLKMYKLPSVIWNISGKYAFFDFDFKQGNGDGNRILTREEIKELKNKLINLPWVYAIWDSLSETGLGILIHYDHQIKNKEDWEIFYVSVLNELQHITGHKPDAKCKNLKRKNVLSHDLDLWINQEVLPFPLDKIMDNDQGVHSDSKMNEKLTYLTSKCTPNFKNKGKFYSQSYLDLHFSQYLDVALFVDEKSGYAVFPNKMTKIGLYTPKNKKFGTSRKKTMFYSLITRYYLNPTYKHENLYKWFRSHNNLICDPPLPDDVLQGVWDYALSCVKSEDFCIKGNRDCFVHFFSTCKLSLNEKKSVVGKCRIIRTKNAIKLAIQRLIEIGQPITKKAVAEKSGFQERTVCKYWIEFLPDELRISIEEHKFKYYTTQFSIAWTTEEQCINSVYEEDLSYLDQSPELDWCPVPEFIEDTESMTEEQLCELIYLNPFHEAAA